MSQKELERYHQLADKRDRGTMTRKEHGEWIALVNKSFSENAGKALASCLKGFGI
jgi:hypothetical protein